MDGFGKFVIWTRFLSHTFVFFQHNGIRLDFFRRSCNSRCINFNQRPLIHSIVHTSVSQRSSTNLRHLVSLDDRSLGFLHSIGFTNLAITFRIAIHIPKVLDFNPSPATWCRSNTLSNNFKITHEERATGRLIEQQYDFAYWSQIDPSEITK